ncbi:MAG: M42 family metallopeptidase [Thermomicrobiales bacterium]|nr:M42 family metallopeptidase [Thermomicrobiales bacterium]
MEPRAFDLLRRLLDAPSPSGFEQAAARIWREEAETFADEVTTDLMGNTFALVRSASGSANAPKVLAAGHIDEIGFIVSQIDEQGFLWLQRLGGWDEQVIVGQRIRILGTQGDVVGVIGKKAAHLLTPEDRDKPARLRDLWVDIGARDRADAETRVEVGCAAVIDAHFLQITDDLCVSRSMDNRVGAFVGLEAARQLAAERASVDFVAVATVQEETGLTGARVAAFSAAPRVAIALDVTHATDYPGADKHSNAEVTLGGGPVLSRGATLSPVVFQGLRDAARRIDLPYQLQATGNNSGTDADSMIESGPGTAAGLISIPNRYMHSPNEMVSLADLGACARLLAEFVRGVTPDSDFRPR